jgi:hypothetical protein
MLDYDSLETNICPCRNQRVAVNTLQGLYVIGSDTCVRVCSQVFSHHLYIITHHTKEDTDYGLLVTMDSPMEWFYRSCLMTGVFDAPLCTRKYGLERHVCVCARTFLCISFSP